MAWSGFRLQFWCQFPILASKFDIICFSTDFFVFSRFCPIFVVRSFPSLRATLAKVETVLVSQNPCVPGFVLAHECRPWKMSINSEVSIKDNIWINDEGLRPLRKSFLGQIFCDEHHQRNCLDKWLIILKKFHEKVNQNMTNALCLDFFYCWGSLCKECWRKFGPKIAIFRVASAGGISMREELSRSTIVGGVRVDTAIQQAAQQFKGCRKWEPLQ